MPSIRDPMLMEFRILWKTLINRVIDARFPKQDDEVQELLLRVSLRCVAGLIAIFITDRIDFEYMTVKILMGSLVLYALYAAFAFRSDAGLKKIRE